MSEMFSIHVLNRGTTWVDLTLTQVHPDCSPTSEEKGFALMLLLDCDEDGDSELLGELEDRFDTDELDSKADQFVASVRVYRTEHVPYGEDVRRAERVSSKKELVATHPSSLARAKSLRGVDFTASCLAGASFRGADLRDADFEHADCTRADFSGALLEGARFPGAILDEIHR